MASGKNAHFWMFHLYLICSENICLPYGQLIDWNKIHISYKINQPRKNKEL